MKIAYISYPYKDNPVKRTEQITKITQAIIEKTHGDIFIFVPHITIDAIIKPFIDNNTWWKFILKWEYEIMTRADLFIVGRELDINVSAGMIWEWSYAKFINKDIVNAWDILGISLEEYNKKFVGGDR